jgi:hypothetical protein
VKFANFTRVLFAKEILDQSYKQVPTKKAAFSGGFMCLGNTL